MKWLRMFALTGMLVSAPSFGFAEDKTQDKPVKSSLQQSVGQITQIDTKQRQITLAPQAQQVQVQQDGGKRGERVNVFAINDVTLIGSAAKKGMKGKPTQEESAVKPKVKPNQSQDDSPVAPKVKPNPGQDGDPKPKPTQDDTTPKPKPNPGQDDTPAPKVKPTPEQVEAVPTPKVKPNPGQDVGQKPTQGQFEQLKVGQVVRVRFAIGEDPVQAAIEIVVLKDAP